MSDYDIDPGLIRLAECWPTYPSTSMRTGRTIRSGLLLHDSPEEIRVVRCMNCDDEIHPDDVHGRLGHLMLSHGYRMDGRRFDDRNRETGHA